MKIIIPTKKGCLAFILVLIGMLMRQYLKGIRAASWPRRKTELVLQPFHLFFKQTQDETIPVALEKVRSVNELFVLDEIRAVLIAFSYSQPFPGLNMRLTDSKYPGRREMEALSLFPLKNFSVHYNDPNVARQE